MARLIDADAMHKFVENMVSKKEGAFANGVPYEWAYTLAAVDAQPTVNAVPAVHGRWIKDQQSKFEHRYNCSACGYRLIDEPCNYCPNCGADMRERSEGE
jgi:rubrerythrin